MSSCTWNQNLPTVHRHPTEAKDQNITELEHLTSFRSKVFFVQEDSVLTSFINGQTLSSPMKLFPPVPYTLTRIGG